MEIFYYSYLWHKKDTGFVYSSKSDERFTFLNFFSDIFKVFRAAGLLRETVTAGASCTNGTTGSSQLLTPLPARCPPAGPPTCCRRVFLLAFACLRLRRCQFSTMASRNLLSKKATISTAALEVDLSVPCKSCKHTYNDHIVVHIQLQSCITISSCYGNAITIVMFACIHCEHWVSNKH